jgi:hypothetical protein
MVNAKSVLEIIKGAINYLIVKGKMDL